MTGTNTSYQSVFSWRYGSEEMRSIFSEQHKFELWRKMWVGLAEAQYKAGLLSKKEFDDLKKHQNNIDIKRISEIEKEVDHDVVAAIREFAEKAKIGGGKIHLGATSMDINDNADILRYSEALYLIEKKLEKLLTDLSEKIATYADTSCMAYTHLNPAEPTTLGYRFAFYAQDILTDYHYLQFIKTQLKAKGFKGAVGTSASYTALLGDKEKAWQMEKEAMDSVGLDAALITTQVYSRKVDYFILSFLNSVASSVNKFASDVRILQSPMYGEWNEPFGKNQVGSSAMPFKRNPKNSEKICSLARYVNQLPQIVLENASVSFLERTLDDSANRRIVLPDAFLAVDEILKTADKVLNGLVMNQEKIKINLQTYAPFSATESILIAAVKKGANRQEMHEVLREIALTAWQDVQKGKANPIEKLLGENKTIANYLQSKELKKLLDVSDHIGNAPQRAKKLIKEIRKVVKND